VDVGGTFTDLVLVDATGAARTRKLLSTTGNYADAIIAGARALLLDAGAPAADVGEVIHGTTVATNAILERRGARTGLITTEGFRDLLEIGRLRLSRLYDLDFERPAPLVPRRWRLEVTERMSHAGAVITPLDPSSAAAAILIGGEPPNNEGYFRPIEVIAPPGTIVNPVLPAAVAARGLTGFRLANALF